MLQNGLKMGFYEGGGVRSKSHFLGFRTVESGYWPVRRASVKRTIAILGDFLYFVFFSFFVVTLFQIVYVLFCAFN